MTRATALAHSNLAFVKYWGKRDPKYNIPLNNSISMNLSAARTITTVELDTKLTQDCVVIKTQYGDQKEATARFTARVSKHLDRIRALAGVSSPVMVTTFNSFPAGTGFASSASGFAALTMAAQEAFGLNLDERALSRLARQGSGSACRSIPAGFVEWYAGQGDADSYAQTLAQPEHWPLHDVAVIVAAEEKAVSSSDGHLLATQSPFWPARTQQLPARLDRVRQAILDRDFETFGQEIEQEALSMHAIMMTSADETEQGGWHSGIFYWTPQTLELLIAVQHWRDEGLPVYFTLDAGPTVHLLCEAPYSDAVEEAVAALQDGRDWTVLVSEPAGAAQIVPNLPGS